MAPKRKVQAKVLLPKTKGTGKKTSKAVAAARIPSSSDEVAEANYQNNIDDRELRNARRRLRSSSRELVGPLKGRNNEGPTAPRKLSKRPSTRKSSVSIPRKSRKIERPGNSRSSRVINEEDDREEEDNGNVNRSELGGSGDEQEEVGENEVTKPIWENFKDFVAKTRVVEAKKRGNLLRTMKEFKEKTENPLRAEVFACVKAFVGNDTSNLMSLLEELEVANVEDILRKKPYFSSSENLKHAMLRVITYIMDNLGEQKTIYNLMCYLNLKVAFRKRESIEWSGFELKTSEDAPNNEFTDPPDDSPMEHAEMEKIRQQIRKDLRRNLRKEYGNKGIFVNTLVNDKFIFAAVMDVETSTPTSRGDNRSGGLKCSTIVLAFNPKLPYVFVHGVATQDRMLNLLPSLPGGFRYVRSLNLKDPGLTPVYTSTCRVSSSSILASRTFNRRLDEEEDLEERQDMRELAAFQQNSKRRKVMKNLINDQQRGGFKSLRLQFVQSKAPERPVTFKFKAPDGNMDGLVADLFERRIWSNPMPYVKARDMKTNFLKLEVNEETGSIEYGLAVPEEDIGL